jgi:predicted Zn finger-like uncharacterized protein
MRIVCPSCEAAYDVPDTLVARRRTLRCARCGREWATEPPPEQAPPADAPPAEAPAPEAGVPEPVPEVVTPPPEPPQPLRAAATLSEALADQLVSQPPSRPAAATLRGGAVRRAWIASLALLAALAFAAWHYRADVMHVWPASERVYRVFGPAGQ